jgi:hypothetical protein
MSASTTVVSMRSLRPRRSLSPASLPSNASLSWVIVPGPARPTSLTSVVGCGTGRSNGMRAKRRQVIESPTSQTSVW